MRRSTDWDAVTVGCTYRHAGRFFGYDCRRARGVVLSDFVGTRGAHRQGGFTFINARSLALDCRTHGAESSRDVRPICFQLTTAPRTPGPMMPGPFLHPSGTYRSASCSPRSRRPRRACSRGIHLPTAWVSPDMRTLYFAAPSLDDFPLLYDAATQRRIGWFSRVGWSVGPPVRFDVDADGLVWAPSGSALACPKIPTARSTPNRHSAN